MDLDIIKSKLFTILSEFNYDDRGPTPGEKAISYFDEIEQNLYLLNDTEFRLLIHFLINECVLENNDDCMISLQTFLNALKHLIIIENTISDLIIEKLNKSTSLNTSQHLLNILFILEGQIPLGLLNKLKEYPTMKVIVFREILHYHDWYEALYLLIDSKPEHVLKISTMTIYLDQYLEDLEEGVIKNNYLKELKTISEKVPFLKEHLEDLIG